MNKKLLSVLLLLAASLTAFTQTYSFKVSVIGTGKPVILIPGLTCTGDVWNGTVDRLKSKYQCHVLTLPGFGKQSPITGPYLPRVRDEIISYVKAKHLNHPAVIGHSLGGFMVFSLGSTEPTLFGPLIAVDGLPFFSIVFNANATAESSKPMAEAMAKQMSSGTSEQFKAGIRTSLIRQITDPKNVEAMYAFCADSGPTDTSEAIKEMMTTDLRGEVSKIQSPLLLLAVGSWAQSDEQKESLKKMYTAQIASVPHGKVEVAWKARHFIQLDDPEFFYKSVKDFLAGNWRKG